MTPVAESIITTLSLYPSLATVTLIKIEEHHGFETRAIRDALEDLILIKRIAVAGDSVSLVAKPWDFDPLPPSALAAADQYRRAHHPAFSDRVCAKIASCWRFVMDRFDRWMYGAGLLVITTFLSIGLCMGADVPDRIIAALVQVESGCEWRGIGDVRGTWQRGDAGEVSAFQLSPIALTAMGASDRIARVHRDPVLAESFARLWLSRCFEQAGTWEGALARYNAGSRHRSRSARDYAMRVLNLAHSF